MHLCPHFSSSSKIKAIALEIAEYKSYRDIESIVPSSLYRNYNTDGPLLLGERQVYHELVKYN